MTNTHKHGKRYSEKRTKTIINQTIQKMFDAIKRPRTNRACRFVDYHIHLLSNGDSLNSRDGEGITMESSDVHEGDVFEVVKLSQWGLVSRREDPRNGATFKSGVNLEIAKISIIGVPPNVINCNYHCIYT